MRQNKRRNKMSIRRKVGLAIVFLIIAIQFIRPARNASAQPGTNVFEQQYGVSPALANVFKTSCYDCHSNNTRYPWYANIQPVAWYLGHHVNEGKEELNLEEFGNYTQRRKLSKLKEIRTSVKEGSMPLSSYTVIHTDAKLDEASKALIINWATNTMDSLSNTHN
jgi:hypothetical protein